MVCWKHIELLGIIMNIINTSVVILSTFTLFTSFSLPWSLVDMLFKENSFLLFSFQSTIIFLLVYSLHSTCTMPCLSLFPNILLYCKFECCSDHFFILFKIVPLPLYYWLFPCIIGLANCWDILALMEFPDATCDRCNMCEKCNTCD